MTTQPKYLWLDLETTGLDPSRCRILECAALITDAGLCPVEGTLDVVLWQPSFALARMDDYVREMHTKNRLLDDVARSHKSESWLDERLCNLIDGLEWQDGKPILAGASIHFDRGFLKQWCPTFEARLHHRHLDVSSLKAMRVDLTGKPFAKAEAHRAMTDAVESLEQAQEIYNECAPGLLSAETHPGHTLRCLMANLGHHAFLCEAIRCAGLDPQWSTETGKKRRQELADLLGLVLR